MITRPGLPDQEETLETIQSGGFFYIEGDDPGNGDPLPATYVLLAYDSGTNYDGYGGTAE